MSDPVLHLAQAEKDASAARQRLNITLVALQDRLEPKRLARETARDLTQASGVAARRTADAARRNPGALAGVVAVAGLFLARHRIAALFRRRPEATADVDVS